MGTGFFTADKAAEVKDRVEITPPLHLHAFTAWTNTNLATLVVVVAVLVVYPLVSL
jgi:hypothetical protein